MPTWLQRRAGEGSTAASIASVFAVLLHLVPDPVVEPVMAFLATVAALVGIVTPDAGDK